MKLYHAPGACSLAVHIALREAGLSPALVKVDLATHRLASGEDYLSINPRGYVPLLELDDGTRHTEAAALLQYVGDLDPAGRLLAAPGSSDRFQTVQWLTLISTELHKVFSPWLWHKETADSTAKDCREKLAARFTELDAHLATRDYLLGHAFSVADAYCFTIVNWSNFLAISLKPYPALGAYLARVAARPAVHAALVAEGLVKA
jgi:glutathione S-transferase